MYSQYAVTAIDAYGNESPLIPIKSPFITIKEGSTPSERVKKAFEPLRGKK
jgi:hypothetical protein